MVVPGRYTLRGAFGSARTTGFVRTGLPAGPAQSAAAGAPAEPRPAVAGGGCTSAPVLQVHGGGLEPPRPGCGALGRGQPRSSAAGASTCFATRAGAGRAAVASLRSPASGPVALRRGRRIHGRAAGPPPRPETLSAF